MSKTNSEQAMSDALALLARAVTEAQAAPRWEARARVISCAVAVAEAESRVRWPRPHSAEVRDKLRQRQVREALGLAADDVRPWNQVLDQVRAAASPMKGLRERVSRLERDAEQRRAFVVKLLTMLEQHGLAPEFTIDEGLRIGHSIKVEPTSKEQP